MMSFKSFNYATKHCFNLPMNVDIKNLLFSFLEVDSLDNIQCLTSSNAIKCNEEYERTYHGKKYFKKGGDNGLLIDVFTFKESFYGVPIVVFQVLRDNFEDVENDFFYIYRKNSKVKIITDKKITINKKDTFGYNEILIEVDPNMSGKELLDIIKRQLNRISPKKPVNYGREITIKIKGLPSS